MWKKERDDYLDDPDLGFCQSMLLPSSGSRNSDNRFVNLSKQWLLGLKRSSHRNQTGLINTII